MKPQQARGHIHTVHEAHGRRLRLFAERRVPGRAWLEFSAEPDGSSTVLRQTAQLELSGFAGML